MNKVLFACLVMLTLLACLGCNNSNQFPLAKVSGVVLCEGQPVPFVHVEFSPIRPKGEKSAVVGARAVANTDKDGKFVLATYNRAKNDGAVVGKHEVHVSATSETNASTPAALSVYEKVTEVEVAKGQTNEFTIELRKRNPRQQLVIPQ